MRIWRLGARAKALRQEPLGSTGQSKAGSGGQARKPGQPAHPEVCALRRSDETLAFYSKHSGRLGSLTVRGLREECKGFTMGVLSPTGNSSTVQRAHGVPRCPAWGWGSFGGREGLVDILKRMPVAAGDGVGVGVCS